VKDRPKHAIGETVVVFLEILAREVGHNVGRAVALDRFGARLSCRLDHAAPAHPDARVPFQRGLERDFKPASVDAALAFWIGDTVRDYEDACQ